MLSVYINTVSVTKNCNISHPHKKKSYTIKEVLYKVFGEGNGNPLKYSCLENPRDRGA